MPTNPVTNKAERIRDLQDLLKQLPDTYFPITSTYNAINEYDFRQLPAELREPTKQNVKILNLGMMIVYLFALFESYLQWDEWKGLDDPKEEVYKEAYAEIFPIIDRLKAYRHIRHSFAHNPNGEKARQQATEFDLLMANDKPLKGVRVNDGNRIEPSFSSIEELIYCMRTVAALAHSYVMFPADHPSRAQ